MSLTGCPPAAGATLAQLAAERVELMALLSLVLDGDAAYSANPRLQMVTRVVPELEDDPAARRLRELRRTTNRDRAVKGLVSAAHGLAVPAEVTALADALDALSDRWESLLGGLAAPLAAAYRDMRARADPLAAGLDPAGDMAAITGERDPLRLEVLPSLFLPPPQNGRHSVLIDRPGDGATAYLHYGFPLDDDPAQFGINRYWLMGGAWHYAVHRFIERHWPAIGPKLRGLPALEKALTAALADHRDSVAWPQVIAEHVGIGLKCVLCEHAGMPEIVHRGFARTQGMAFFGWFREWAAALARRPERFVAEFRRLPQLLDAQREELVAIAAATPSGPASINFALASHQHRRVIVLPDHWDDRLRERIGRRWSIITPALLRESEWRRAPEPDSASVIAFGQLGHDLMVDDLLAPRGLTLEESTDGGEVLVSLLPPERARKPWQLAIAVRDPEVAGNFSAEHVMGLFHGTARFAGYRFVEGDGMAMSL